MATSGADTRDGGLWNSLQGVRLGARERELLVVAGRQPEGYGLVMNTGARGRDARSLRVAYLRAARKLEGLRLVELRREPAGPNAGRIVLAITRQGRVVYERFGHELLSGARIRWPRSDEPDGRFYHESPRSRARAKK